VVVGGDGNQATSPRSVVVGGQANDAGGVSENVVVGGANNSFTNTGSPNARGVLLGGVNLNYPGGFSFGVFSTPVGLP